MVYSFSKSLSTESTQSEQEHFPQNIHVRTYIITLEHKACPRTLGT